MVSVLLTLVFYSDHAFASHGWITFLEGSFAGRFIDAKTAQPIEGVVIVAAYQIGIIGPVEGRTEIISYKEDISNIKGEFYLSPHVFFYPSPFTSGEKSYFIAYKPGYKFYQSSKDDLDKNNTIKLEPVPSTFYPRYEALERARGSYQHWVDWQKTTLLKKIVLAEESQLMQLEKYPAGVISNSLPDGISLTLPQDIAIYDRYIFVADGGLSHRIIRLNFNGDWVSTNGVGSQGDFDFSIQKDGFLWVTSGNELNKYDADQDKAINRRPKFIMLGGKYKVYIDDDSFMGFVEEQIQLNHVMRSKSDAKKKQVERKIDTFHFHRFKIDKQNNFHFIAQYPTGLYLINKMGDIIAKHTGRGYSTIALDSDDNSYVANLSEMTKFNANMMPLISVNIEAAENEIKREGFISISIDRSDTVYLSLKDSIRIYDKDLNLKKIITLKNEALGEIAVKAIAVDEGARHLYLIDSIYNRVLAYDLSNDSWVSKQRLETQ